LHKAIAVRTVLMGGLRDVRCETFEMQRVRCEGSETGVVVSVSDEVCIVVKRSLLVYRLNIVVLLVAVIGFLSLVLISE
jgi:hypothetical protein